MTTFRVRALALGEVSANLQTVLTVFDGNVAEFSRVVSTVSGVSWEGEDQQKFVELFEQWKLSADGVRVALTQLAAQLAAAEQAYTQTETSMRSALVSGRQAQHGMVDEVREVDAVIDTGLERVRAVEAVKRLDAITGGMFSSRSGQGEARSTSRSGATEDREIQRG